MSVFTILVQEFRSRRQINRTSIPLFGRRNVDPKFVPKSISCFFLFAARSVSKVVTSKSVSQTVVESISVLTDVSITRIIGVHSTVATFYQWSFLANFSLNGAFRLRFIIIKYTSPIIVVVRLCFILLKVTTSILMWLLSSVKVLNAMT